MDKRNILLAVAAALALCVVVIATMVPPAAEAPASTRPPVQVTDPAEHETDAQDKPAASDLWSDDGTLHSIKPLDVALDAETQWAIYAACGYDTGLFCFVMAIAEHESGFDPQTAGDGGSSLGMMQINTKWHTGRMEALGVTDLTDPVQCAAVAVDYLQELESRYGFEPEGEAILMAYNCGPSGAKRLIEAGTASTAYSQEIITVFRSYRAELEGNQ